MRDDQIKQVLDAWAQAFWQFRDDVGIGDSFSAESARLDKNLRLIDGDLKCGDSAAPAKIRAFLLKYGSVSDEINGILTTVEAKAGLPDAGSRVLDYFEYLRY